MWKIASATAWLATISLTLMLKGLQLFKWIAWHPTAGLKPYIEDALVRWGVLFLLMYVATLGLYIVLQYTYKAPSYVVGGGLGVLLSVISQWWLLDLPLEWASWKQLSIPFSVLVTMQLLFIVETATFHRESFVNRNNLPYNTTMLK